MRCSDQSREYLKTLTVLYVEDDEATRFSVERLLKRSVGTLVAASQGAEGLEAFRVHAPQIVITDILMPVMDGLDMAQEIRALNRSVPIIITTAFEQSDYLMRAIDIGVDRYVTKPIMAEKLHAALMDCAQRLHDQDYIRHIALHDPLTDLPNRALLKERLDMAFASASRNSEQLAMMFIDIDRFKSINDTFGHAAGDWALQEISTRLKLLYRSCDTVCRLSGDEFLVVITGVRDPADLDHTARKTLDVLQYDVTQDGKCIRLTASIGIALYPGDGTKMDELIHNADCAMYHAKQQGGNACRRYGADRKQEQG